MAVAIDIRYLGDLHCEALHQPSGERLATDAPIDNGGRGAAFSPTDLVATALGTCLATVMGLVARRDGIALEGMCVHVVKEMAAQPVRKIGALLVEVTMPAGMSPANRRLLEATARTCPVRQSLHGDVHVGIKFTYPD